MTFFVFLRLFRLPQKKMEKDGKAPENDFDQQTACGAPVCWSKYTTSEGASIIVRLAPK